MTNDLNITFDLKDFVTETHRILVTGGAGFIGGCLVRRLLQTTNAKIFNLDKFGYASDLSSIEALRQSSGRHELIIADLADLDTIKDAIKYSDPDIVFHLAAESHVDRSIEGPKSFLDSNVIGTFNLLQAVR